MPTVHRDWSRQVWLAPDNQDSLQTFIQYPDRAFQSTNARVFKDDKTTTVAVVESQSQQGGVVFKRFNARSKFHLIKRLFRKTRARRCWRMAQHFSAVGIPVAKPLMMLEKRFGPMKFDAFYVTEYIAGAPLLDLLPSLNEQELNRALQSIESIFTIFKNKRLSHGDMKATNLIWFEGQVYLIDLDASRHHKLDLTWRSANNRDKRRFLKNWQSDTALYGRIESMLDSI